MPKVRRRMGVENTRRTLNTDKVTEMLGTKIAEKHGITWSAAICRLVLRAGLQDEELRGYITEIVRNKVTAELALDENVEGASVKVARRLMGESADAYFDRLLEQGELTE